MVFIWHVLYFSNIWFLALITFFSEYWSAGPTPQPPTWRTRVSLLFWHLTLILSGEGDPNSSYGTAGLALGILELRSPITRYKVPSSRWRYLEMDNGDIIAGCTEFRHLGTIFTKDGRDIKNIRHRVTQARKIIGALNGVWWSKNITRNRKKMMYDSMVKSVLIYWAEIWSLYEDDRRRINATEMDALRRPARISKVDRKTNEYIRWKMDAQDMILDEITRKQLI